MSRTIMCVRLWIYNLHRRSTLLGGVFMTRRISLSASAFFIAINFMIWAGEPVLAQQAFPANQVTTDVFVEDVEIQGNRRIPRESILYYVQTKPQDRFDPAQAQRDLQSILQMGLFDSLATKLLTEDGNRVWVIVIFRVYESQYFCVTG